MATSKYVDLHTHSVYSDGQDTPAQIIAKAVKRSLAAVSITDHDSLTACTEGALAAREAGIVYVPGIELSTADNNVDAHILGYHIDPDHDELNAVCRQYRAARQERVRAILEKLLAIGVELKYDDLLKDSDPSAVGRPHVAMALKARGIVSSVEEAFQRFLGRGQPAFVDKAKISPAEAFALIRRANGIPIVAHPIFVPDEALLHFKSQGMLGIEVWHCDHGPEAVKRYFDFAKDHGLLTTGGSDYHGSEGAELGAYPVPFSTVENLRQAHRELNIDQARPGDARAARI